MAYCTKATVLLQIPETVLIQLTDDANIGAVNDVVLTNAIAAADAEINTYCSAHYSVPFSPVPDIIQSISIDITIYNLYSRKVDEIKPPIKDRYERCIDMLREIASGGIALADADTGSYGSIKCNYTYDDRIFTMTTLEGM